VSITRSSLRKKKSTTWPGSQTHPLGPHSSLRSRGAFAVLGSHFLTPTIPLSETYVYVGCLRSAHFAAHAERWQTELRASALREQLSYLCRPMTAGA
jgi:hypothetical protein